MCWAHLFCRPCPPPPHTKKYFPCGQATPYNAMPYLNSLGLVPTLGLPIEAAGSYVLLAITLVLLYCLSTDVRH